MSEYGFGSIKQLLVCCVFVGIMRVPKWFTLQLCSQVTHLMSNVPDLSARTNRFRSDPSSLTVPSLPVKHQSFMLLQVRSFSSPLKLLKTCHWSKWCWELDMADCFWNEHSHRTGVQRVAADACHGCAAA